MPDLSHQWGSDLLLSPSGDIGQADGVLLNRQRILRRLLTNPGDYMWSPDYGAGLGRFIGQPASELRIRAEIRSQVFKEPSVARNPEPIIDINISPGGQAGLILVLLRYVDAQAAATQTLSFSVSS